MLREQVRQKKGGRSAVPITAKLKVIDGHLRAVTGPHPCLLQDFLFQYTRTWDANNSVPPKLVMKWARCALTVLVLLVPAYDLQMPSRSQEPEVDDSLRLANILMQRPVEGPSVRTECRLLNATEYQRIVNAINAAKLDTRVRPNVHDAFSFLHAHPEINKGAHQGPAFLPYHRVLVFLYEKMLRIYDRSVSLCYWDTTVEPDVLDWSALWTPELFGNPRGAVTTGFARGWITPLRTLNREESHHTPFSQTSTKASILEVSNILEEKNVIIIIAIHSRFTTQSIQVETAAYDPIFWFHHAFVDCLYERFRTRQKDRGINPMRDWPAEHGDSTHAPFAPMRLGSLRNIDGAQDFFSKEIVRCTPMPVCSSDSECGQYMRCDRARQKCISD
ncbi:hypothetical protein EGW08_020050, partial [Elysia chlorotica]